MAFKQELFKCHEDPKLLATSWCCAPCSLGQAYGAIKNKDDKEFKFWKDPVNGLALPFCCGLCTNYLLREEVKKEYSIEEDLPMNVLGVWCCGVCGLAQVRNEMRENGLPIAVIPSLDNKQ